MIPSAEQKFVNIGKWQSIDGKSSTTAKIEGSYNSNIEYNSVLKFIKIYGFFIPKEAHSLHGLTLIQLPENVRPKETIIIYDGAYYTENDDKTQPYNLQIRTDGQIRFNTSLDTLRKSAYWNFSLVLTDDRWNISE